ncbi:MAG: glycosyltransferase family 4 protein [Sphingomonadaceae bacterium]|nr:glycosyltransferase family 4 protein [Sphingomonadaceae bacterium]
MGDQQKIHRAVGSREDPTRHVVFVIAGLGAGGAERVISLISAAWVAQGWRVTILAFDRPEEPVYHDFDPRVDIRRFGVRTAGGGIRSILGQGRRILTIRRELRALNPDAVISMLTKINVLTLAATIGTTHKVIVSERNNPQAQKANTAWNTLLGKLYPRAAAIVMQTRASMVCLPQQVRGKAHIIPNPISSAVLGGGEVKDKLVLTAAGRLTHQKGFDLLIDAFAKLAERHPDWVLKIWGEGDMRGTLETQIRKLGLTQRVKLPGTSKSPGSWIDQGTIMVLSSRYEGFPNVLGEAMASGMPVVAFDCDFGPREIIQNGYDGLLVPMGDVAALADAMDRLMRDKRLRNGLGAAARLSALRFAPGKIVAQWGGLVNEVAQRG